MRNCLLVWILVAVGVFAVSPVILAQTAARAGSTKTMPDLSGGWDVPPAERNLRGAGASGPREDFFHAFVNGEPSMTPWAEERYKALKRGITDPNAVPPDEFDPETYCFPRGPTRIFSSSFPFEIRQHPDVVLLLFERDHWVRRIYVDGRGHPDGYPLTWMGHSIGKWDGDTLVVDTIGINDKSWIDSQGHPHTDALHLVERFRRRKHDILEYQVTFDDPKAYTKPWGGKKDFQLMRPGQEIMEHVTCEDLLEMGKRGFLPYAPRGSSGIWTPLGLP